MQKNTRGFTLIELMVVLIIITTLLTVITLSYVSVQKDIRDNKRKADVEILIAALEKYYDKYGEYPRSGTGAGYNSSDLLINETTTLTQLQQGLDTKAKIFDPSDTTNDSTGLNTYTPFKAPGSYSPRGYRYVGGLYNATTSTSYTVTYAYYRTDSALQCKGSMVGNSEGSSFVLSYYNESERKTYLYTGKRGTLPVMTANAACVFIANR